MREIAKMLSGRAHIREIPNDLPMASALLGVDNLCCFAMTRAFAALRRLFQPCFPFSLNRFYCSLMAFYATVFSRCTPRLPRKTAR